MAATADASRRLRWDDAAWTCVTPDLCVRCGEGALTLDNRAALADECGNFYHGHEQWLRSGCSRPYQYQPLGDHDDDDDDDGDNDVREQEQHQVNLNSDTKKKKKKKTDSSSSEESDSSSSSSSSDEDSSSSDSSDSSSSSESSSDSSSSSESSSSSSDSNHEKTKKSAKLKDQPLPSSVTLPSKEVRPTKAKKPSSREDASLSPAPGRRDLTSVVGKVVRCEGDRSSTRESSFERPPRQLSSKVVLTKRREDPEEPRHAALSDEDSSVDDFSSHTFTSKVDRVRTRHIINWEDEDHDNSRSQHSKEYYRKKS